MELLLQKKSNKSIAFKFKGSETLFVSHSALARVNVILSSRSEVGETISSLTLNNPGYPPNPSYLASRVLYE